MQNIDFNRLLKIAATAALTAVVADLARTQFSGPLGDIIAKVLGNGNTPTVKGV